MATSGESFKPLHLSGGRFDDASTGVVGFPLEVIAELARYERLLIKVARELWKRRHPSRTRAPKGFDEGLRLRLTAVDTGSVAPVLAPRELPTGALFTDDWTAESQQTIADALAAVVAGAALPGAFPEEATATLVLFGSSFRSDERCRVHRPSGDDVVYTQHDRRHLVSIASPEDIKVDGRLVGTISALDAKRQTFEFADRLGDRAAGSFEQIGMVADLRRYLDRDAVAPFVRITCRYSTDEGGHLSRIEDVEEVEAIIDVHEALGAQLRDLMALPSGWDGEDAQAPEVGAIEWARDFAADLTPAEAVRLGVFPTHEGGVLLEQQTEVGRWSLEVESGGEACVITVPRDGGPTLVPVETPDVALTHLRTFTS